MSWKRRYQFHKNKAKSRNIPFTLTFEEWMYIWISSGQWMNRGRGKGKYVMSRVGDQGPYAIGNVFIQSNAQNISDAVKGKSHKPRSEEYRQKLSKALKGKPISIETRQSRLGKSPSIETRQKISDAQKGKPWSEARRLAQTKIA